MTKKLEPEEKILIAGASGMVGSAVKRLLEKKGLGKNLLIPNRKELDLLDSKKVSNWFKKNSPKIVILAAAKVGGIYANDMYPVNFILENIKIQTNVIESAWFNNVRRLVFLGSSCIYPKYSIQPIKEEFLLSGELESTNQWYAIAKIAGMKLCESLRIQYEFDAISLMPTNLYGPNDNYHDQNSHVIASLIRKFLTAKSQNLSSVTCWGSGSVLREFMHVDDLAEAVYFCLENWFPGTHNAPLDINGMPLTHLNVGTGQDISIIELAEKIAKITNFRGDIIWDKSKPDGTPKKQLDVSRVNNLGWKAKIDLDTGIKETILHLKNSNLELNLSPNSE